jgi:uncharacterized protein (TIGR00730 family)
MTSKKKDLKTLQSELEKSVAEDVTIRHLDLLQESIQAEIGLEKAEITKAIVFFGSARIRSTAKAKRRVRVIKWKLRKRPNCKALMEDYEIAKNIYKNSLYLKEAEKLAALISMNSEGYTVFTGGGAGFMSAANKGAFKVNKPSVSLRIRLKKTEKPNPYNTPDLTFYFNSFAMRKLHLIIRARAIIMFPGGFGTLDELFEALVLRQTHKIEDIPIIMFNKEFWNNTLNFEYLVKSGTISSFNVNNIHYVSNAVEAWDILSPIITK